MLFLRYMQFFWFLLNVLHGERVMACAGDWIIGCHSARGRHVLVPGVGVCLPHGGGESERSVIREKEEEEKKRKGVV